MRPVLDSAGGVRVKAKTGLAILGLAMVSLLAGAPASGAQAPATNQVVGLGILGGSLQFYLRVESGPGGANPAGRLTVNNSNNDPFFAGNATCVAVADNTATMTFDSDDGTPGVTIRVVDNAASGVPDQFYVENPRDCADWRGGSQIDVTAGNISVNGIPTGPNYVALGDSYSSGEGAPDNSEDGFALDPGQANCHRSLRAWPVVLSNAIGEPLNALSFFACSGATTTELRDEQIPKLRRLVAFGAKPKVTLTIGGDDFGFANVLELCEAEIRCQDDPALQFTLDQIRTSRGYLSSIFAQVAEAAGLADRVWVIAYPQIFAEKRCLGSGGIGGGEQKFLNDATQQLNLALGQAAFDAKVHFLRTSRAMEGHRLCNKVSFFNGNQLPLIYSFHPNAYGQAVLANWIRDHMH